MHHCKQCGRFTKREWWSSGFCSLLYHWCKRCQIREGD